MMPCLLFTIIKLMKLVIVESPVKCKKIKSFLGKDFMVQATMGHFVEIRGNLSGIDFKTFELDYQITKARRKTIQALAKSCQHADTVFLATDPDREGEAIAFHLCRFLRLPPNETPRARFHEITKKAVVAAVDRPGRIDMGLVRAQQARQIFDLVIGFRVSPFLWANVGPRLSAGRCQSPALKMVHVKEQGVSDSSTLQKAFHARFDFREHGLRGCRLVGDLPEMKACITFLREMKRINHYVLTRADNTDKTESPPPPFITSTIQRAPHGLGVAACMQVLQSLYEKGKITYMRTDNPCLSEVAMKECQALIESRYGPAFHTRRVFSSKSQSQDAHEAIRPTDLSLEALPEGFTGAEKRLYRLIRSRAIASQMSPHRFLETKAVIECGSRLFHHTRCRTLHPGWKILYATTTDNDADADSADPLPEMPCVLSFIGGVVLEEIERPGARHSEASLVRELESNGIGRPSTYGYICSTLTRRAYAQIDDLPGVMVRRRRITVSADYRCEIKTESIEVGREVKKLRMTELGKKVVEYLNGSFPPIMEYEFTERMEQDLDRIASDPLQFHPIVAKNIESIQQVIQRAVTVSGAKGNVRKSRVG